MKDTPAKFVERLASKQLAGDGRKVKTAGNQCQRVRLWKTSFDAQCFSADTEKIAPGQYRRHFRQHETTSAKIE